MDAKAINEFLDALAEGAKGLAGARLSSAQILKARRAIGAINSVVQTSDILQASNLIIGEDGALDVAVEFPAVQCLELDAEGISLEAGIRLSTFLTKARTNAGLTVKEFIADLPISEDMYRMLEAGVNLRVPDDILQKLAEKTASTIEELRRMQEFDIDFPVQSAPYNYARPY